MPLLLGFNMAKIPAIKHLPEGKAPEEDAYKLKALPR
jgi:hypothetical protein